MSEEARSAGEAVSLGDTGEDAVVELRDVAVHFERGGGLFSQPDTVRAVDGVSLSIPPSSVVVLVGESGCGKTTLGKTAIGVQRPTAGQVLYRGHDVWAARRGDAEIAFDEVRRSLQMIHQDPGSALNPNRKVLGSLAAPLRRWFPDLSREDRLERILAMLERVGMTPASDYAQRYPHQLSGGEQQRVALVRALLMNPDLILADEAISALDVSLRIEMMDLMLELQDHFETSFLAISHDLANARYFAGKADGYIGIMYLGEIVEFGPAEAVVSNPTHPYTKALRWATPSLGEPASEDLPVRSLDIPDPVDPPSGCRFHTRCPQAREACRESTPAAVSTGNRGDHVAGCFRAQADHGYWDSEALPGVEAVAGAGDDGDAGAAESDD
jgi:peptide/nickel transport system ATP-binding protein